MDAPTSGFVLVPTERVAHVEESLRAILDHVKALSTVRADDDPFGRDWIANSRAKILIASGPTLARWRANGTLKYAKVGGKIWYRRSDIDRLLESKLTRRMVDAN